jgi:hypothetical protein
MTNTPRYPDEDLLPWRASPPLAPGGRDSNDEPRLIRAMIAVLTRCHPSSDAEALKFLRRSFPETPLATRIAALAARCEIEPGARSMSYMPR